MGAAVSKRRTKAAAAGSEAQNASPSLIMRNMKNISQSVYLLMFSVILMRCALKVLGVYLSSVFEVGLTILPLYLVGGIYLKLDDTPSLTLLSIIIRVCQTKVETGKTRFYKYMARYH